MELSVGPNKGIASEKWRMQHRVNRFYRSFLTLYLEELCVWTLTPAIRIFAHILLVCRINKQPPCNDSETELRKENKEIL